MERKDRCDFIINQFKTSLTAQLVNMSYEDRISVIVDVATLMRISLSPYVKNTEQFFTVH